MTLRRLDHVTVNCADLERSRTFYAQVLALRDGERPAFPFPGAWLYAGERPVIHLVGEGAAQPSTGAFDHVAFEAEDFDGTRARFEALNIPFRESRVPAAGLRQLFVHDPDGVKIELNFRG
jgi:catechol 2,3-dioxygenase-like lactoylglutathione lyase family enzyme